MAPIRLTTLGRTDLVDAEGRSVEAVLKQPKRFALFVYLAVESRRGFVRRDRLIALFWPESDQQRGRQNLRKALSFLRASLGDEVITSRGNEEVRVDADRLSCDVCGLLEGSWSEDVEPDTDFLDAFHFHGAPVEWEEWVDAVRRKVRDRLAGAPPNGASVEQNGTRPRASVHPETRPVPRHSASARRVAMASAALLAVLFAWWLVPGGDDLTQSHIAVFPTRVAPDQDAFSSSSVALLLSNKLDGAGAVTTADVNEILPAELVKDVSTANDIAERFATGMFVVVSTVESVDSLMAFATLYRTGADLEPLARVDATVASEDLNGVSRELARRLVPHLPIGEGEFLDAVTSEMTDSYEALHHYLRGEHAIRLRRFDVAQEEFGAAIEIDSMFGAARFREAWSYLFPSGGGPGGARAVEALRPYRHLLDEREQQTLDGWIYFHEDWERADRHYRNLIATDPTWVNAMIMQGLTLRWHEWRSGRVMGEAQRIFERVLELDPTHPTAHYSLAAIAFEELRYEEMAEIHARFLSWPDPPAMWVTEFGARNAGISRSQARVDSTVAVLRHGTRRDLHGVLREAPPPMGLGVAAIHAEPARAPAERARGHTYLAMFHAGIGSWSSASEELAKLAALSPDDAVPWGAWIALTPHLELPNEVLADYRDRVEAWDGEIDLFLGPPVLFGDELEPHVRTYLLGLLEARLGATERARAMADELDALQSSDCSTFLADLALEIRAQSLIMEGDDVGALQTLEGQTFDVCVPGTWKSGIHMRPYGRFLRAQLLTEAGRTDEAQSMWSSFGRLWGLEFAQWRPYSIYWRGFLSRDPADTERYYTYFVDWWDDADEPYQPLVDAARAWLEQRETLPQ